MKKECEDMVKDNFTIYASSIDEMDSCRVWIGCRGILPFKSRSVVKITNNANGKKVYCEFYLIDKNYMENYNTRPKTVKIKPQQEVVVLNNWYRSRLCINETQKKYSLTIRSVNRVVGSVMLNSGHPQSIVRMAFWLGVLGAVLGFLGVIK